MIYQNEFALKEIVWAKVPNYPWWPARIVHRLPAPKANIYKVHFFGDPTQQLSIQCSCYLQSQYLCHFENELVQTQSQRECFQFLKRPIQLAKAAYNKSKISPLDIAKNFPSLPSISTKNQIFQESKLASNELENIMFHSQTWQQSKIEFQPLTSDYQKLSLENSPQFAQSSVFKEFNELKSSKGYNNKKQALRMHLQLKQQILSKYSLLHIPKVQENIKPFTLPISRDRRFKNQKPKDKNFMSLAFRKLFKILVMQFSCTGSRARQVAGKIMNFLQSNYGTNRGRLSKQFVSCVRLRKSSQSIDQYLYNICEKGQNQCLTIQKQTTKEEEEQSKVTLAGSLSVC